MVFLWKTLRMKVVELVPKFVEAEKLIEVEFQRSVELVKLFALELRKLVDF